MIWPRQSRDPTTTTTDHTPPPTRQRPSRSLLSPFPRITVSASYYSYSMTSSHPNISTLYKYSPAFNPPRSRQSHPLVTFVFRYLLLPLNGIFIAWAFIMTWAYVHPTSLPTSYPLRSRGAKQFRLLFIFHILSALVLGGVNLIILYAAFAHDKRRRKTWLRNVLCNCHMAAPIRTAGAVLGLAVVGFYPLIIAAFVREPAARFAFGNACRGFELMAEIEVLDDFPRYGTVLADASSTIKFFKRGAFQYTMDLVRAHNSTLG